MSAPNAQRLAAILDVLDHPDIETMILHGLDGHDAAQEALLRAGEDLVRRERERSRTLDLVAGVIWHRVDHQGDDR